eukprot:CAMPEP_0174371964 /NCGR_PEP_ID=MMETSP0811_2-20130205/101715_1 /TAXON_ID=73025 ORGANISM="Eutreptiella gymnastica-like, Strain CCMP1594" /NCGR_SAMPLE_ID=MMETSP0811_2 /ASSEMBLY_ACC=CAM_ASM_000667 /LENGTH=81 /DNA_ID=CAMNT_0015518873 /DNA_START=55 /DNA_END=297 /DNA_ORIENTATION=-
MVSTAAKDPKDCTACTVCACNANGTKGGVKKIPRDTTTNLGPRGPCETQMLASGHCSDGSLARVAQGIERNHGYAPKDSDW